MAIVNKPVDQMNMETLALLRANTALTKVSAGTLTQSILRAVNAKLSQNNELLSAQLAQSYLSSATGESLDQLGVLLNIPRGGSVLGTRGNVQKFYCTSGSLDTLPGMPNPIPTGTIVQSEDGTIQFRVAADITFSNGDISAIGSIEAIVAGSDSNVGANILIAHGLDVPGLLTTNLEAIDNGSDVQTDEEYRYILSKAVTAAEAANTTAIRLAALSVSGVSDVLVIPYMHGIGTYGVIVTSATPIVSDAVLANVFSAVSKVTAAGEFCTVRSPRYIGLEIIAKIIFRPTTQELDKPTIIERVEDTIYDYVNNIPMGQGFVRNELIQRIMDISEQILDVEDEDTSEDKLAVYQWSPTVSDVVNNVVITNRVREPLAYNYAPFFDDKHLIEQDMQGYVHESDFTPVIITSE